MRLFGRKEKSTAKGAGVIQDVAMASIETTADSIRVASGRNPGPIILYHSFPEVIEKISKDPIFAGAHFKVIEPSGSESGPFVSGINLFSTETLKNFVEKGIFAKFKQAILLSDDYKTAQQILGWPLAGEALSDQYGRHESKQRVN